MTISIRRITASAVSVLEHAARAVGADARVRQNLALAHALQGDWTAAKTVAAQDVPADQLNARIQQWMTFATPARASDQVAALTGVTPAASDPGQPSRLALAPQETRTAAADPVFVPVAEPEPIMVAEAPAPLPTPAAYSAVADTQPAMAVVDEPVVAAPQPVVEAPKPQPEPVAIEAVVPKPQPKRVAAKVSTPKPSLSPRAASLSEGRPAVTRAAFPKIARGDSQSVVQIGAYASRSFVGVAWGNLSKKYPALRGYTPSTARFASDKGTVFRLSVQGFASDGDARDFCEALQRAGGKCFVRSIAGDAPVRLASL